MDIQRRVYNLIRKYKTNCPFELAGYLNINVVFEHLPEGTRGFYDRVLRRRFIVLNKNLVYEEQRFTCAHELGHDRIHSGAKMGYYFIEEHTLFNPGKIEREANVFAVKLLLGFSQPEEEETSEHFCMRHGIPKEMIQYL